LENVPEVYTGTKFKTVFASKKAPTDPQINELIKWCRRFAELGLAPGGSGNMSIRSGGGFIVSRTAGHLGLIKADEFVEVLKADVERRELAVNGSHEPSSESMMHAAIYAARPDAGAVFHGHHERMLAEGERLGLAITEREQPYGTPEIVREVLRTLGKNNFLLIRNHGFASIGANMTQAGRQTEAVLARLLNKP
jgi:ribulose-5-phosphate 4-epimerase/fuculose-1-phosphate aldolase